MSWIEILKQATRCPHELLRRLELDPGQLPLAHEGQRQFPVFVPEPYLTRMERGNPRDPLLLQVWPHGAEDDEVPGFSPDPVADAAAHQPPGVIRKYPGRALLIVSGACAIHCRYCFRRHFPYTTAPHAPAQWQPALDQLAADGELRELILSGGDPLTLRDSSLTELFQRFAGLPQVTRLRIHTRLPIVIPQRVTPDLLSLIANARWQIVIVLHVNHPRELDESVRVAVGQLHQAGAVLLNQAVLLRGVNDSRCVLSELSERLMECRVTPYYLHQLDRVTGAAHFEVPMQVGAQWVRELREQLPGYLVPRFVRDTPGQLSKEWLGE